jgi:hypothetical protein
MEEDDDSAFQQRQVIRPWNGTCKFCGKTFNRPGSLTSHLNTSCGAAKSGLAWRLHQARERSNAKRALSETDPDGTGNTKKLRRWYGGDEDLEFDHYVKGGKGKNKVKLLTNHSPFSHGSQHMFRTQNQSTTLAQAYLVHLGTLMYKPRPLEPSKAKKTPWKPFLQRRKRRKGEENGSRVHAIFCSNTGTLFQAKPTSHWYMRLLSRRTKPLDLLSQKLLPRLLPLL